VIYLLNKDGRLYKLTALFFAFFKIGAFTFGGGFSMIPVIGRETVDRRHWLKKEDILDTIAISQSLPGSIAINTAAIVGYRIAGMAGAFCAAAGVVLPSFFVIYLLSFILGNITRFRFVGYIYFGIRAGVLALITNALFDMAGQCPPGKLSYIISFLVFSAVVFFDVNILTVILCSAAAGIITALIAAKRSKADDIS
jgi:chromate transporter